MKKASFGNRSSGAAKMYTAQLSQKGREISEVSEHGNQGNKAAVCTFFIAVICFYAKL